MATWKQIEQAREIRMWIKEVILPVGVASVVLASNPDVRKGIADGCKSCKTKIKNKFRKNKLESV